MESVERLFMAYGILFLGILVFDLIFNVVILRFARTLGMGSNGSAHAPERWNPERRPTLGGITLFVSFLLSLVIAFGMPFSSDLSSDHSMPGLLMAVSLGFLMGLADDAYHTRPFLKLFVQILCGVILIGSGVSISLFHSTIANDVLTVVWVVGIMNSFNMIDNMDGIAGSLALVICIAVLVHLYFLNELAGTYQVILIGLTSGILGFLWFNWFPSKMFMGDAGSQFLGVFLAFIGIEYFWNLEVPHSFGSFHGKVAGGWAQQLMTVGLIFWTSIVDTGVVFIHRIKNGRSPLVGGKDHTTHAFSYLGLSDGIVGWIFFSWTLFNAFLGVMVIHGLEELTPWGFVLLAYMLITFVIMFILVGKAEAKNGNDQE